jgi:hypothetical protein
MRMLDLSTNTVAVTSSDDRQHLNRSMSWAMGHRPLYQTCYKCFKDPSNGPGFEAWGLVVQAGC